MWNDLPYTVIDTDTLNWFKGAVVALRVCSISICSLAQMLVALRMQSVHYFVFPTWACTAGFNNNKTNIISHVFRPPPRRGSHVKSDNIHSIYLKPAP